MNNIALPYPIGRNFAVVFTSITLLLTVSAAHCESMAPDARIQAELQTLHKYMVMAPPDNATEAVIDKVIMNLTMLKLQKLGKTDQPGYLMSQLIYYAANRTEELSWAVPGIVIQSTHMHPTSQIAGAIPILTDKNPRAGHIAEETIGMIANIHHIHGCADFIYFTSFLDSTALVHLMFKISPRDALIVMMDNTINTNRPENKEQYDRVTAIHKSIRWASHVVSDTLWKQEHGFLDKDQIEQVAMEQLNMLSQRPEWWARMYVASFIQKHPAFRTPALTARLQNDTHPLVASVIAEILDADAKLKQGIR